MPDELVPGAQAGETVSTPAGMAQAVGQDVFGTTGPFTGLDWLGSIVGIAPGVPPPPLGPKMPADKRVATDKAVAAAENAKQMEADKANPLFSFLGLPETSWQDVGVFAGLTILFIVGVIMLLNATGVKR